MRIAVLVKPVPDTASGGERLRPDDWRLDRAATSAVVNANDEYALEAALKLTEAHGGEVVLVTMAGTGAPDTMRKALAMGAASGVLVTDDALGGSDMVSTTRVLAGALGAMEYDLAAVGLRQLERRLERVLVVRVDDRRRRRPVKAPVVVGAEALTARGGVRNGLHEDDDAHRRRASLSGLDGVGASGHRCAVSARAMTSRWICCVPS